MSRTRRLTVVLLLNLALVTALVVTGLAAHSLAVLAAGADYLADAAAVAVSLLAIWLATRPRGHPRATTMAALVNAGWLLVVNVVIAVTAIGRLAAGTHRVHGLPVLVVSAVAAVVMLAGALILGGDDDGGGEGDDLNVKAVLLDTAADAAAAAGVAASGAVILGTGGWYWLDPATALAIAVIVSYLTLKLLRTISKAARQENLRRACGRLLVPSPPWASTPMGAGRGGAGGAGQRTVPVSGRCRSAAVPVGGRCRSVGGTGQRAVTGTPSMRAVRPAASSRSVGLMVRSCRT